MQSLQVFSKFALYAHMNYFKEINLENIYPYFSSTPSIVAALYLRLMLNITMRLT